MTGVVLMEAALDEWRDREEPDLAAGFVGLDVCCEEGEQSVEVDVCAVA
jgi:hypothetical protein